MAHIRDTNVVSRMESLHVDEARDVASRRRISSPRKRYNPPARSATKIVGKRDDQRSARYHANVLWSVVRCSVCWKEPTLSALLFFLRPLLTALSTPTEKRERERERAAFEPRGKMICSGEQRRSNYKRADKTRWDHGIQRNHGINSMLSLSPYLGNRTTGRNERFWNANRSDLSLRVIRERRCGCIQKFALWSALWTRFEAIRGRGHPVAIVS